MKKAVFSVICFMMLFSTAAADIWTGYSASDFPFQSSSYGDGPGSYHLTVEGQGSWAVIGFNFPSYLAGAQISSAILGVSANYYGSNGYFDILMVSYPMDKLLASGVLVPHMQPSTWVAVDVTDAVKRWLGSGGYSQEQNLGLKMIMTNNTNGSILTSSWPGCGTYCNSADYWPVMTINYSLPSPCVYSIGPSSIRFGIDETTKDITITSSNSSCVWSISNLPDWITVSETTGSGTATVQLTAQANPGMEQRAATIEVAGQSVSVMQGGLADVSKVGIFRAGRWILDLDGNGAYNLGVDKVYTYGKSGDIVVYGDWNGDGRTKIGVFRGGVWFLDYKGTGVWTGCGAPNDPSKDLCAVFGRSGDIPVVGDWTGDGRSKIGVFRSGVWYLDSLGDYTWSGCGGPADLTKDLCIRYGELGDIPVTGDWNGDGTTKVGIYRDGSWHLDYNGTRVWTDCGGPADPTNNVCITFEAAGNTPIVGDWNGDGKAKVGVFNNGLWFLDYNGTGDWSSCGAPSDPTMDACVGWGKSGDLPVVGKW